MLFETDEIFQDITQATNLAFQMVTQMGMSDTLGNIDLYTDYSQLSSQTKTQIEREVRRLVEEGRQRAIKLLTEKRSELDIIAKALVEYEVLNLDEMNRVLKGEKLQRKLTALPPKAQLILPEIVLPPGIGGGSGGVASGATNGDDSSRPGGSGGAKL